MKKQIILGSFLAFASMANAQVWTGPLNNTSTTYRLGNVGIGSSLAPVNNLYIQSVITNGGITVEQVGTGSSPGASALTLRNSTSSGRTWMLASTGLGNAQGSGNFDIVDFGVGSPGGTSLGAVSRLFIQGTTGDVGIGGVSNPNNARLFVTKNISPTNPITYWGVNASAQAVSPISPPGNGHSTIIGVQGSATGNTNQGFITGVYGKVQNGLQIVAGDFLATGTAAGGGGWPNYAVRAIINTNASSTTNYGVYASASGSSINWAGYFQGNVNINGAAYCTSAAWSSDKKLKKDIKPLLNGMDKIKLLKPSTYNFKTDEFKSLNLPSENQIGLIAQELEQVFPELVNEIPARTENDKDGNIIEITPEHKAVNYIGLIPVLISGIQEQQKLIETQQKQLDEQKELINALLTKTGNTTGVNQLNNGADGFALDQNIPNPFSQETVIKYTLTQQTKTAVLNVYDLSGKQITSFPLTERGASSITISSEKLAAGIYIYSVIADGKIMDSKRMVVAQK